MLEESLDPRPSLPLELARVRTGSNVLEALPTDLLAQVWNDDASYWSNLRTLGDWIERARR
jgi:hypothetical protein